MCCWQSAELRAHRTVAVHISSFRSVDSIGRSVVVGKRRSLGLKLARSPVKIYSPIYKLYTHTHARVYPVTIDGLRRQQRQQRRRRRLRAFRVCVYFICSASRRQWVIFRRRICVKSVRAGSRLSAISLGAGARVLFVVKEPYNFSVDSSRRAALCIHIIHIYRRGRGRSPVSHMRKRLRSVVTPPRWSREIVRTHHRIANVNNITYCGFLVHRCCV